MLLVDICNALALGLIQPWLPAPENKQSVVLEPPPEGDKDGPKRGSKVPPAAAAKGKVGGQSFTIPSEAIPDLKKATEVSIIIIIIIIVIVINRSFIKFH